MTGLFIILFLIFAAGGVLAGAFWNMREGRKTAQKNLEKGLQMVPLLIHLPPMSDDTNLGGRDERDVVDETISKAQIIYNIIASATQESGKSKSNDDKEIGFEIVGTQGFVYFYASVAVGLVSVVKQAIVSAYPSAQIEEALEHNIFNQIGGMTAVAGGEMVLKEPYAFPIATYQDLKRDAMQSILNSLANLDKEDGVAVQMVFRPADKKWRKAAVDIANKKRKGKYDTKSGMDMVGPLAKQMVTALVKPPEGDKDKENSSNDLSGLDRSVVDAIEDKTRYPGFEVCIRIVTSSNITQRSQAMLQNIVAAFGLFDAPGKNGFKFEGAKDIQELVNNYLLRSFTKHKQKIILNAVELATLFHFPDQNNIPTSQLVRQASKQVDGPRNIPEEGLLLGYNVFRGAKKPIRLALQDRQRHMYVVGQTGTGKSTFLENLALQDMLSGNGFAFVDPHGDTVEKLLSMVPKERTEDVIYFSPADMAYPMGLNLFEYNNPDQKDFLIQEALNMLYKLYDPQHQGIMGPRYEHLFRMAALTVMADPKGGTFVDIPKLFRDPTYVKQKLEHVKDQNVIEFWQKEMPQSQRSNEFGEVVSWFVSKFGAFLSNEMMRNIIGQTKSAFDLRDVMDNKKILLVNLSKGRTGELNSKLLGMIFVMKFQAAAMSRANIPEDQRQDFTLYVDEFQNFSTDSFATIMSEARKYHLNLTVANQFTTQLTEEIRDAVFGNMGTIVSFRIGQNDVDSLSKYFQPIFDGDDLLRVPNYNTIVRTLVSGVPTQPFSMATLPPLGNPNPKLSQALKQLSAAKYGRPRGSVEDEIFTRMKTLTPPRPLATAPSFGAGQSAGPARFGPPPAGGGAPQSMAPSPSSPSAPAARPSSFLDDWLAKRKNVAPQPSTPPPSGTAAPYDPLTNPASQPPAPSGHPTLLSTEESSRHHPVINKPQEPPAPVQPPADAPKNISSEAIDKQEIGEIAEELKQSLQTAAPAAKEPKETAATDKPPADSDAADTIAIDADGNLIIKNTDD